MSALQEYPWRTLLSFHVNATGTRGCQVFFSCDSNWLFIRDLAEQVRHYAPELAVITYGKLQAGVSHRTLHNSSNVSIPVGKQ